MKNREFILNAIRSHKSELAKFGINNIGLFGSYVSGEASEDPIEYLKHIRDECSFILSVSGEGLSEK